jgi:hypothetical protein
LGYLCFPWLLILKEAIIQLVCKLFYVFSAAVLQGADGSFSFGGMGRWHLAACAIYW